MIGIVTRLDAIAGLASRASLPAPGTASAAAPYATAATLLRQLGELVDRVRPGMGDGAFVRADDIATVRHRLHQIAVEIEVVAGFSDHAVDRESRLDALRRALTGVEHIRIALNISAAQAA